MKARDLRDESLIYRGACGDWHWAPRPCAVCDALAHELAEAA